MRTVLSTLASALLLGALPAHAGPGIPAGHDDNSTYPEDASPWTKDATAPARPDGGQARTARRPDPLRAPAASTAVAGPEARDEGEVRAAAPSDVVPAQDVRADPTP